jgi:DNA-binding response OmpR family regulator
MQNKRILVIDDDPWIREIVCLCLSEIGNFDVIAASSGGEGLAEVEKEHPDAILLDLCMPQMDGMEVLRQLRNCQTTQGIPVIIFSAIASLISPDCLIKKGVVETIVKPFNCLTLPARIAHACHWDEA